MQVLKFGGSSVANAENIDKVVTLVKRALDKDKTILVVSALGGITDMLIQAGVSAAAGDESYKDRLREIEHRHLETVKSLLPITGQSAILSAVKTRCNEIEDICSGVFLLGELSPRTQDKIVSYGELLSSLIISVRFDSLGVKHEWIDSRRVIRTDAHFGHAAVDFAKTNALVREVIDAAKADLSIFPGFIASTDKDITTTLGRGGSDYTAAILAAAVDARSLEIWTDVSGMMTADPRLVSHPKLIPHISYQEAMELSHFGAKVIYPPTISPVMRKAIPVWIKNTFAPADAGTIIEFEAIRNGSSIRGISSIPRVALLSLEGSGMVGIPGFSKRLFEALSNHQINVILITQGSSEHSICVGIDDANAPDAKAAVDQAFEHEITIGTVEPLAIERDLSIIALVGDRMKSHPGVSGKLFGALGRNGVNVRAIAQGSSERNISAVIATGDVRKAINVLHEEFFETSYRQLNLFITGTGNVGRRLLDQLLQQQTWLLRHLRIQLHVVGLANSRKMVFRDEGIDLHDWKETLDNSCPMQLDAWIEGITSRNLRNAVFVDVTANGDVAAQYGSLLQKSISVVACNKIACSSRYDSYRQLKDLASEYNARFLFETNVGAGLPVIGTLNDLLRSGDTVRRIEAVLSGTLNFVFNNYTGDRPFSEVVRQAQQEGYTEPDPRLDLTGTDVMRKIMILARESGGLTEMEDIENHSFLPASCMDGSVEDFYSAMTKEEDHFSRLYKAAATEGKKLKFVARYDNGEATVGLHHIGPEHDLYHLYGKDNVVLFYTDRYPEQPLVIKGAGAGAEVTASGVFADILRAINT